MNNNHQTNNRFISNLSVDCVVFGYSSGQLKVLLIRRKPFPNVREEQFAIPGDLVYEAESLDDSAKRILHDLTRIHGIFLKQFYTFGDPDRVSAAKDKEWLKAFRQDPDARVITVAYYALVRAEDYDPAPSSFAGETYWANINEVPTLAFDHNLILDKALQYLRDELITHQVGFELLPKKFTLTDLQSLYESILDRPLDKRNFRKSLKGKKYLKELDEKVSGMAHRPAKLYTYIKS